MGAPLSHGNKRRDPFLCGRSREVARHKRGEVCVGNGEEGGGEVTRELPFSSHFKTQYV